MKLLPESHHLANNPSSLPKYSLKIKNKENQEVAVADPRATRALVALMNYHAVIGGAACHWGGPSALAEIMSSLHTLFFQKKSWFDHYNFVNDAGHTENGIYALRANWGFDNLTFNDLKKFRSIESKLTGHGESHLNPQGVLLSNGPLGSAFPQSQGLTLADKFKKNNRTTVCVISDGGMMEGEAKEALAAIPGLAQKNKTNPYVLIISDNNTKLSGRIDADSFSMDPTFLALSTLGWELIKLEHGHDLPQVYLTLEQALEKAQKNPQKPVCVWIKTIKGYGVKSTAESSSGGHGFPLKKGDGKLLSFLQEIYQGENVPEEFTQWAQELMNLPTSSSHSTNPVKKEKIQVGIAKALIESAQEGFPVVSVSADLQGSTGLESFRKAYPDLSFDVGVAESNMISTAAGFSKLGFIPVVDTFAQFGITKGNLPLTMAALSQSPLIGVFSHTGFQDAADGASHQATTYLAATCALPHTQVVVCSCSSEAYALMKEAVKKIHQERLQGKTGESVLFFLGREDFPPTYQENPTYAWGKAQVLWGDSKNHQVTLVSHGSMVGEMLKACEELEKKGVKVCGINNAFTNLPDLNTIGNAVTVSKKLITLEDHQIVGGMGSLLTHSLVQAGYNFKLKSLGINGDFGQSAYKASQLYQSRKMDSSAVVQAVLELV